MRKYCSLIALLPLLACQTPKSDKESDKGSEEKAVEEKATVAADAKAAKPEKADAGAKKEEKAAEAKKAEPERKPLPVLSPEEAKKRAENYPACNELVTAKLLEKTCDVKVSFAKPLEDSKTPYHCKLEGTVKGDKGHTFAIRALDNGVNATMPIKLSNPGRINTRALFVKNGVQFSIEEKLKPGTKKLDFACTPKMLKHVANTVSKRLP